MKITQKKENLFFLLNTIFEFTKKLYGDSEFKFIKISSIFTTEEADPQKGQISLSEIFPLAFESLPKLTVIFFFYLFFSFIHLRVLSFTISLRKETIGFHYY